MLHTAYKATTTRNAYGDYISTGETAHACHFREITNIITEANEVIQSDAMAWFEPDSGIDKSDIIKINGTHYRVEKITKARRLHNPNVLFIKAELLKYGVIS